MKKIYCVEEWMDEYEYVRGWFYDPFRTWSMGKFSFVTEYEDEEEFKQSIVDRINNCVPITDIFIKEVPDDYDMKHKILIKL